MSHTHNWKQRMALAVLPPIGAIVFRLLGMTLRFEDIGAPGTHADDHPETRVYCLWHRSLLSIAHHFRKRRIAILISPSFDGELSAAMIHRVGYTPVRGSSSRGGAAGLLGMQRALEATNGSRCNYAAFTSDGPRGPVYHAKPGGVKLAQQVGGGVGIFYAAPDRAWTLKSWDGFLIPKPFSTIVIGWQPPVPVESLAAAPPENEEADGKSWEPARLAVEQALERARHEVEENIARKRGNGVGDPPHSSQKMA
ncbi:MAG: lysophospholipid acyltransferase family protein [Acidobacteriaceae bacterium]